MSGAPPPYPGQNPAYPPPAENPSYPPPGDDKGTYPPPSGYPPPGQVSYPPQPYGQPAQPGYAPQPVQPAPGQTVVVTQPTVVTTVVQHFRDIPVNTKCPHCQAQVVTAIHFESGTITWIVCLILCLVGLWVGCCLIPFCIDACKDCVHTCPNCRQQIARYNRM